MFGGISINLTRWSYAGRKMVRGYFDKFPNTTIYFRRIRRYYIVYSLDWIKEDPVVEREDREEMQILLNRELGREKEYKKRKSRSS
ncbi:hypothetical protein SAMN05216353_1553 [Halobacillus alkaliphilus]|uniref:Uncharacterized protein n=1 Tax=Halobacillus alkaliphilus TaxID=396056 RepID=A0A1I2SWC9_9BACI|nr:hypothetical protein [Halobacillus alkaliphilus]SFG55237.1 hypothetical protein SAMN05216353_1553 [Halobacillus alkaliphilus]